MGNNVMRSRSRPEYAARRQAWRTQAKRVRACAISVDVLLNDIFRLNLVLRFLQSLKDNDILQCRLYTKTSKVSQIMWKSEKNTIIRVDILSSSLSDVDNVKNERKSEFGEKLHPNEDRGRNEKDINQKMIKVSHCLSLSEFYYLFLFIEDKLPEISSFWMNLNDEKKNHIRDLNENNRDNIDNMNQGNNNTDNLNDNKCERSVEVENKIENKIETKIETETCIICYNLITDGLWLPCSHQYCRKCITQWEKESKGAGCPICRCVISQNEMFMQVEDEEFSNDYIQSLIMFPFQYCQLFPQF